jgi:hypothetical protein
LRDVFVWAAQAVADGIAGGLRPGDLLVELRELALHELPPVAGRAGAGGQQCLLLGEGEPRVAVEQDGGDEPGATADTSRGAAREIGEMLRDAGFVRMSTQTLPLSPQ